MPRTVHYDYTPSPGPQTLAHHTFVDEMLYGGAAGGGKALALDTPIPTPYGWTTMGALRVGDFVMDADGHPTQVTAATDTMHDHDVYLVTFDDGSTITADADHRWLTFDTKELAALTRCAPEWRARRRASRPSRGTGKRPDLAKRNAETRSGGQLPTGSVRTTLEILATLRTPSGRANHAVPVAKPLDLPIADLLIDPYILGYWLGDGHTKSAAITTADEWVVDEIRRLGQKVTKWSSKYGYGLPGMHVQLREIGVLGNKHIPAVYSRASIEQRLHLMQGIVDSDGHVADDGKVEVTLTHERLAHEVHELACSLGLKATIRESLAKIDGRVIGPRWRVCWTSTARTARMPRKADKLPTVTRRVSQFRYVKSVELVPSVPVRCISVDNPRRLFLAGDAMVPTHNSRMARAEAVLNCLRVPGMRAIIFRRTFPDLERSVVEPLLQEIPRELGRYNSTKHLFRFFNGSILELGHLQRRDDLMKYQGAEYQLVVLEEGTHFLYEMFDYMRSRLRAGGPVAEELARLGMRPRIIITANPGGIGHHWVKREFIDPAPAGKVWRPRPTADEPNPPTRCYVPARATDNPYLDKGYINRLNSMSENLRRALRDGDWDVLDGVRFPDFNRNIHVIEPEQLPIPPGGGYPRSIGVDYGSSAPFAALWGAKLSDNLIVVYRELYKKGLTPQQQAELIRDSEAPGERMQDRPIHIALDPSMWARNVNNPLAQAKGDAPPPGSIADAYYQVFGGQISKARNERIGGWALLDEQMRIREDGLPRLLIYSTCTNLIRTLPAAPRDVRNPDDVDTTAEEHAVDALRYLCQDLVGKAQPAPFDAQQWAANRRTSTVTGDLASARL